MELRTYLAIMNKRKKLIAIIFSILFLLVVIVTLLIPPKYSSTAQLRVLTPIGGGTNYLNFDIWYATRLMNTYASMASSSAVVDEVKKKFNLTTDPDIKATVIADSELIRINVLDYDPVMSASIANSIAEILLANKNSSALQAQTAADTVLNSQLDEVNQRLTAARAKYRDIFVPYTQNNSKITELNARITNDRALFVALKDRVESGRQAPGVQPAVLAAQESQLSDLQTKIDQENAELDAMNAKAAEDSNQIDSAQREITLIETQYSNIVMQMDQMKSLQALQYSSEGLMVVDQALPSNTPASPNYLLVFLIGFFLCFFFAVMIAITVETMDDTYISPSQISTLNRTPFWGETTSKGASGVSQMTDAGTEELLPPRGEDLKIENFPRNQSLRSLVISGVDKDLSATQTWVKMALEFAQQGRKTILIDADLNSPSVHTHFLSTSNDFGLRQLLDGKITLEASLKDTGRKNLVIMTAGQHEGGTDKGINPIKMGKIIDELLTRFSMVIIGIPTLSALQGHASFVKHTDGVVLVIEYGNSRKRNIRESIEQMSAANIPFLGYILSRQDKTTLTLRYQEQSASPKVAPGM